MADNVTTATAAQQMQASIVSIDTSTNPAVTKINSKLSASKKYILETTQKKITPAINELNKSQKTLSTSLNASVKSVFDLVGNTSTDSELKAKFEECVKTLSTVTDVTVLNTVMNILQRIKNIEDNLGNNEQIETNKNNIDNLNTRIEALESNSSTVEIDFATPEEVLAAMIASDTTSTTESTGEATE